MVKGPNDCERSWCRGLRLTDDRGNIIGTLCKSCAENQRRSLEADQEVKTMEFVQDQREQYTRHYV